MTYIDYINLFWKIHQSEEFSSNETYLYFFLLNECNIRGWQNPFEYPNKRIVLATGMSEKTVIEVRNRLQQKGLLRFEAGKRNAKSPVYYLPEESKEVSKLSSKEVSKTGSKEVSKQVSHIKTKENKREEKDINIPPTPPEGDGDRERKLLEKEVALRAFEEELKKREADLSAQSGKPPADPKVAKALNAGARELFEEHYLNLFSANYYWGAKDAGSMSSLLNKLKYQRKQKNMPIGDENVLSALRYLLNSITEGWIFENFSVTNINSKFNEIVSQAIAKKNGQTTSNASAVENRSGNRRAPSGTDAENKRREREHLGRLADAILQESAAKNSQ